MSNIIIKIEPMPPHDVLGRLWRSLDSKGTHEFFLTWSWIGTWLQMLPPSIKPLLVKAIEGNELVGIATLTLRSGRWRGLLPVRQAFLNATGEAAFDCITVEHNGFASSEACPNDLLESLVKAFALHVIPGDELLLPGITSPISAQHSLIQSCRSSQAFRVSLPGLSNGIEPLLTANARQQLRRSLRACERIGPVSLEVARDPHKALEFFDCLKRFHVGWWERRRRAHAFASPFFETFHRELIRNGVSNGSVDLLRVSAGSHALGYLYNFRRKGTVTSYQSGFDLSDDRLRPGYVSHALAIKYYAAQGGMHYDFLGGTNRLKRSFGASRYQLFWLRFRHRTLLFQIEASLRKSFRSFSETTDC